MQFQADFQKLQFATEPRAYKVTLVTSEMSDEDMLVLKNLVGDTFNVSLVSLQK